MSEEASSRDNGKTEMFTTAWNFSDSNRKPSLVNVQFRCHS